MLPTFCVISKLIAHSTDQSVGYSPSNMQHEGNHEVLVGYFPAVNTQTHGQSNDYQPDGSDAMQSNDVSNGYFPAVNAPSYENSNGYQPNRSDDLHSSHVSNGYFSATNAPSCGHSNGSLPVRNATMHSNYASNATIPAQNHHLPGSSAATRPPRPWHTPVQNMAEDVSLLPTHLAHRHFANYSARLGLRISITVPLQPLPSRPPELGLHSKQYARPSHPKYTAPPFCHC